MSDALSWLRGDAALDRFALLNKFRPGGGRGGREGCMWILNQRILVYLVQTHMVTMRSELHLNTM